MIQDITPHKLDNAFRNAEPRPTDKVFVFCEGKVLASIDEEGMELPDMSSLYFSCFKMAMQTRSFLQEWNT